MGEPSPLHFSILSYPYTILFHKVARLQDFRIPQSKLQETFSQLHNSIFWTHFKDCFTFFLRGLILFGCEQFLPRVSTFLPRLMRIVFIFERKVRKLFEAGSSRSRNWGRSQLWSSSILSPIHIFVLYLIFFFKAPFFLIFLCADFYFVRALVSSSPLFRLPKRNIF